MDGSRVYEDTDLWTLVEWEWAKWVAETRAQRSASESAAMKPRVRAVCGRLRGCWYR